MSEGASSSRGIGAVLRATANYGLGSYVPQLVNFMLVPVYTRYLVPQDMGALEIVLSAQALLIIVMRAGLPGAFARLHFDHDGAAHNDLTTTIHHTMTAAALVIAGAWLFVGPTVMHDVLSLTDVPFSPLMELALAGAILQVAPELQRRLLQVRQESALAATLSAAQAITTTILNLVLVVGLGLGAAGVLAATAATSLVFALIATWRQRADLRGHFRPLILRSALAYGGPLVPHHIAAWTQQYVGRWVLGVVASAGAVGQLALAGRVAAPLAVLTGAFTSAYTPIYFAWRKERSPGEALAEARAVAGLAAGVGAVAVAGASTFGAVVVRHAMDVRYLEAAPLIGVVAFALFFHLLYVLVTVEIFFAKRTAWISIIFTLAAVVNTVIAWELSPRIGALGAALAQLAGGVVGLVAAAVYVRIESPLPLPLRATLAAIACGAAASLYGVLWTPPSFAADVGAATLAFVLLAAVTLGLAGQTKAFFTQGRALTARVTKRLHAR